MMTKKSPSPTDKAVGARVKMRRLMIGWSQERLGKALGLTFQQVQKYEKGANRIGASRLQQLSTILKVPVEFFFDGVGGGTLTITKESKSDLDAIVAFTSSRAGLTIIRSFNKMEPSRQRAMAQAFENMASV